MTKNQWRSGLVSLPVWRRKGKKHAAQRKGKKLTPASGKKRKVYEELLEKSSPEGRVRLHSDSEGGRKKGCIERMGRGEAGKEGCVERMDRRREQEGGLYREELNEGGRKKGCLERMGRRQAGREDV